MCLYFISLGWTPFELFHGNSKISKVSPPKKHVFSPLFTACGKSAGLQLLPGTPTNHQGFIDLRKKIMFIVFIVK